MLFGPWLGFSGLAVFPFECGCGLVFLAPLGFCRLLTDDMFLVGGCGSVSHASVWRFAGVWSLGEVAALGMVMQGVR